MLLVKPGPELPPDAVRSFIASLDTTDGEDLAWFLATAGLGGRTAYQARSWSGRRSGGCSSLAQVTG